MNRFDKTEIDRVMEHLVGRVLQGGVLLAAAVVIVGGGMLLARHGGTTASFATFTGEPASLSTLGGIAKGVAAFDARAIVQLGLVLLIATPVVRVALTVVAFAVQRDRTYVIVSGVVLAVLLGSILLAP